jgi:hypothetical protein
MTLGKIKTTFDRLAIEWRIFLFVFAYVLFAGLLLQKIVLPLTPWHGGQGLLAGGDWIMFQKLALTHAAQVRELGWAVFELKPEGHAPSGLAAFVYVLSGVNEPWVLLPVHGAVYALAALGLFWVVLALGGNKRLALFVLLPMVLMPSLTMVWGQLHKDVWAIAAVLLMLAFWSRLFVGQHWGALGAFLLLAFSNASLWWMRPYTLQIVLVGQGLLMGFLTLTWLKNKNHLSLIFGVLAIAVTFGVWESTKGTSTEPAKGTSTEPAKTCKEWIYTLPVRFLDNTFSSLACTRDALTQALPSAKSNLDLDVTFNSAADVVAYAPRALQVGILAPFPNMWFAEGTTQTSRVFRTVAAFEMGVMYVALLGLCILIALMFKNKSGLRFEQKMAIAALMLFALLWVEIYALASGNVGSIYRVRFPIMLLWMGLGLLGWYRAWGWWQARTPMRHV